MKDIKFRAWSKVDKKMKELTLLEVGKQPLTVYEDFSRVPNIWNGKDIGSRLQQYPDEVELMQYTGLKDKNGKEIYEGDIVKVYLLENEEIFTIKWKNEGFKFCDKNGDAWVVSNTPIEIIGNIYENLELLEVK